MPPPDQTSDEQLKRYMRAGFNVIIMSEDFVRAESQAYLDALKRCERLGLDVIVRGYDNQVPYYFEKHFPNTDFNEYPAVKGFFVHDEPWREELKMMNETYVQWFNEHYAGKTWFMNFYCGQSHQAFQGPTDEFFDEAIKYLYDAVDTDDKYLTIDEYPLVMGAKNGDFYLEDKEWIPYTAQAAVICRDHGIKFGACVQSFQGHSNIRFPQEIGEFRFLVYSNLVFGIQWLGYFTYRSNSEWGMLGLVSEDGRPTKQYFMVQELNQELRSFDEEYLSYDWKGALVVDGKTNAEPNDRFNLARQFLKNYADDELVGVTSQNDCMAGCFERDGKHAYILVNYGEPTLLKNNDIELEFKSAKQLEVIKNGKRETVSVTDGKVKFTLCDGDGMMIKILA